MGYVEIVCQLCGVSFAIGRLRRPDEPQEAAWDYTGSGFVVGNVETAHMSSLNLGKILIFCIVDMGAR